MKNPKNLTLKQKKLLEANKKKVENYKFIKETLEEYIFFNTKVNRTLKIKK